MIANNYTYHASLSIDILIHTNTILFVEKIFYNEIFWSNPLKMAIRLVWDIIISIKSNFEFDEFNLIQLNYKSDLLIVN